MLKLRSETSSQAAVTMTAALFRKLQFDIMEQDKSEKGEGPRER